MKYINRINEGRSTKKYQRAGKLGYNDQFLGRDSLSQTLAEDLDGMDVGFDHVSLYDVNTGETIMDDALSGKYTFDEILKGAKEWYKNHKMYKENESAEVNEGFSGKSDFNKIRKALEKGMVVTAQHARFPKAITIKSIDKNGMYAIVDFHDGRGDGEMAAMNIEPRSIKIMAAEEVTEAKKFKPGDMWSNDFDYEGMLRYAMKVNEKTPIKMLNKLFDSATDVNYHTPFRNLGIAIDWIEDGDKKGAKDYIKNFHNDIKAEMKSQGLK